MSQLKKTFPLFFIVATSALVVALFFWQSSNTIEQPENPTRLIDFQGNTIEYGTMWNEGAGIEISGVLLSNELEKNRKGDYVRIYVQDKISGKEVILKAFLNDRGTRLLVPNGQREREETWFSYEKANLNQHLNKNTQVIIQIHGATIEEYNQFLKNINSSKQVDLEGVSSITLIT